MSEGLFGRFISGLLGWSPASEIRHPEPGPHQCLDPRCSNPLSVEHGRQMDGMRQMDRKSPAALELARGMAAVPQEQLKQRNAEAMLKAFGRQTMGATSPDGQSPEEGKTGRD